MMSIVVRVQVDCGRDSLKQEIKTHFTLWMLSR